MTPEPEDRDAQIAALAKALAHPARLRILRLLAATPGCIGGDIVDAVGLAQSTVSEHLRILKAAGLIKGEISRPCICYALNPGALDILRTFLETVDVPPGDGECRLPDAETFLPQSPREPDVDL